MSEQSLDWEKIESLDFNTPFPPELEKLDEALADLDSSLDVYVGDCNQYAEEQTEDNRDTLEAGVSYVTQRLAETLDTIFDEYDEFTATRAAHGTIIRANQKWVDAYNMLLGVDHIKAWAPEFVQDIIETNKNECETIEESCREIAEVCGLTFQTDLNYFVHYLKTADEEKASTTLILIGRNAIKQLFSMSDGSDQLYLGYPFRVEPGLIILNPNFMSEDVQFNVVDDDGINGTFWTLPSFINNVKKSKRQERILKHIAKSLAYALDPFGEKSYAVTFAENLLPETD